MLHMNGFVKKAAAFIMGIALVSANTAAVRAAEPADLDLTRTGAIELTLTDASGATVSGGAVTVYEVAELYLNDGNMAYEYTQSFADCKATLDVTDTSLAATLVEYVNSNSISGEEKSIEDGGKVSFTNLELGLYLIVQTTESENYETISPFVVTVPIENNGVWDYTVDASPKVGTVTPTEEETEPPTEEETEPETSTETEQETEPETTTTTTTTSTPTLPQTGQLNWPIPLLAAGGCLFLILGRCLSHTKNKKNSYAS